MQNKAIDFQQKLALFSEQWKPKVIAEINDSSPVLARPKLADLLVQVTPENLPDDADISWGKPQGTEE